MLSLKHIQASVSGERSLLRWDTNGIESCHFVITMTFLQLRFSRNTNSKRVSNPSINVHMYLFKVSHIKLYTRTETVKSPCVTKTKNRMEFYCSCYGFSGIFFELCLFANAWPTGRPVPLHPALRPAAGVRRQEPRRVHDGVEAGAENEEGLDAHRTKALRTLRGR